MKIFAIDPGPEWHGWVYYDTATKIPESFGITQTKPLIALIDSLPMAYLVIEKIGTQQGNVVGASVFDTCRNIGRIEQAFNNDDYVSYEHTRSAVIIHLYGFMRRKLPDKTWFKVKDKHINALLIERYGGQEIAVGGIKCPKCKGKGWFGAGRPLCPACNGGKWLYPPGLLFGMKSHIYDALGLAITYTEQKINGNLYQENLKG